MMMNINDEYDDEYNFAETVIKKKKSNKNKRRFTDDQIKSLETIFEGESKLEPRKKLQLARELGLQPRQVAIWFQNKRARYKSKQLEQDYGTLREDYDNLASRFENLKKEKEALQVQLQRLNNQMKKPQEGNQLDGGDETKSESKPTLSSNDSSTKAESFALNEELRHSFSLERSEHNISILSDEDSSIKTEYFGLDEEPELLNMLDHPVESTLTSPENWGSLESGTSYQWWDVWS